jgi:hypothetical protein
MIEIGAAGVIQGGSFYFIDTSVDRGKRQAHRSRCPDQRGPHDRNNSGLVAVISVGPIRTLISLARWWGKVPCHHSLGVSDALHTSIYCMWLCATSIDQRRCAENTLWKKNTHQHRWPVCNGLFRFKPK